jgi:membrane fusion protein (multidrug efflux system)
MAAQPNPLDSVVVHEPVIEVPAQEGVSPRLRRARPHSKTRIVLLAVLALAVLATGSWLWYYLGTYESTDDAQVDVHLAPVSARISGYVIKVNVSDNQFVEKGTVLVELDPRDYEVAVDKAKADLANAEATAQSLNINVPITSVNTVSQISSAASDVRSTQAGIIAAEKQLAAARAQVLQAEANDVRAQDDLVRYKRLVDKQNVSAQTYDQALAAAKGSTASVAAARANESSAEQAVEQAKARLAQAEAAHRYAQTGPQQVASTRARALSASADVQQKRAALEQAQLNLQYSKVVAPVSGLVNKTVVEGMNVQPGQILLNVVPLDEVWITANFKETQLRQMKPGQRVEFEVDSNGRRYKGHVDSIAGATGPLFSALPPENATGNYVKIVQRIPVKIVLDPGQNKDRQLRPGMSVVPKVYLR